jgi:hypothetical protein
MIQAGRSPVQVTHEDFLFDLPNPSSCTMGLESTQPLTEMSTRNLPERKKLPARRADNLAATCEPTVYKMWDLRRLATLRAFTACTGELCARVGSYNAKSKHPYDSQANTRNRCTPHKNFKWAGKICLSVLD